MKKILCLFFSICVFIMILNVDKCKSLQLTDLHAKAVTVYDATTNQYLFEKNSNTILPMASTTKIMTCIIALESLRLDTVTSVSSYAASMPKVKLGIMEGTKITLKDLLYSMMLESHNDSAVAVAEAVAGSVSSFADLMNKKAKNIGCKNTFFITPNGLDNKLDNKIHSTTSDDLALILSYCITKSPQKEEFIKITQCKNYTFSINNKTYSCNNHNRLLDIYNNAITGKTGFTNNAGYCYVGALNVENHIYIISLLACGWPSNKNYKWADISKLLNYIALNYSHNKTDNIKFDGITDIKFPVQYKTITYKDEYDESEMCKPYIVYNIPDKIIPPVFKEEVIGNAICYIDNTILKKMNVVSNANYEKNNYIKNIYNTLKTFFLA